MKIALFNYSSSGLFHYAASLVNALAQQEKVTKIIFFTSKANDIRLITDSPKVRSVVQDAPHKLIPLMRWCCNVREQREIRRIVAQFQPDVIHILDTFPVYLLHHSLLRRYPIVVTQHDPVVHNGDAYRLPTESIHRYLQRLSRRVVVHGNTLKASLEKQGAVPPEKITVIPLGNFSILLKTNNTQPRIPHSLLFFGRIADYKGLDTLLKSLLLLQAEGVPFHLIVAGPGDLSKYQASLNLIKEKTIANYYIPDSEVSKYIARSEIMVLPYHEATQSAAAALGLAAGMPIIASRVGALPEVLIDSYNSLLVDPHNVEDLKEKIKLLLENQALRQRLASGARVTAKEQLSWETTSGQYMNVYNDAINS